VRQTVPDFSARSPPGQRLAATSGTKLNVSERGRDYPQLSDPTARVMDAVNKVAPVSDRQAPVEDWRYSARSSSRSVCAHKSIFRPSTHPTVATTTSFPRSRRTRRGQKLFVAHCSICHGPTGKAARARRLAQPSLPARRTTSSSRRSSSRACRAPRCRGRDSFRSDQNGRGFCPFARSSPARGGRRGDASRGAQLYATKGASPKT